MPETTSPETPDSCEDCGKTLMLRRPGRTHCEACRPTMRGVRCTTLPAGYTTIFAHVRFTERYEAKAAVSGHVEVYEAGETINPVQLHDCGSQDHDPTGPMAVWVTEPVADTGVCGDWVYIPGSVVEILKHWPA